MAAERFPVEAGHVLAFARSLGADDPGENLLRFGVRFTAQVWPGDTLTVHCAVVRVAGEDGDAVAEFSVSTVNGEGREVMSGYAHARLAG